MTGTVDLMDDWVVLVDEMNYTLARDKGERVDKNGKIIHDYDRVGYYGSLRAALMALAEKMSTDRLKSGYHSLLEAVRIIQKSNDTVRQALEELRI